MRPAQRVGPDGDVLNQLIIILTQQRHVPLETGQVLTFRGGCTLIIDLAMAEVRYMVRKKVDSPWRLQNQLGFAAAASDLGANYFTTEAATREPFAMIHHVHG